MWGEAFYVLQVLSVFAIFALAVILIGMFVSLMGIFISVAYHATRFIVKWVEGKVRR